MQIELLQQLLFDPCRYSVAEERAVGHDHARSARLGSPSQLTHDELQEQKRRLRCLLVLGKVAQDAALLLASEGWIGQDHVHPVLVTYLSQGKAQAVLRVDLRKLQTMQEQVHLAEHVGQRLGLASLRCSSSGVSQSPPQFCTARTGA